MKKIVLIAFFLIGVIVNAQIPSYVPSNGLVGWWPFNGNANDESGNGNHGTVNGATLTTDRFGNNNAAYDFDADEIIMTNSFYNNGWQDYSISFWFNTQNLSQQAQNFFNTYPHDGEGFGWNHPNSPNKISHWKNQDPNVHIWNIFSANPLNYIGVIQNEWVFLTIVKSNLTYCYFVNGQLDKTSVASLSALNQNTGLRFGSIGSAEYFNGDLDDIGIWNRALTEQEILALYQGCQMSITTQPTNQSVNLSAGNTSFNVVTNATNPTYQWQSNLGLGFQNLTLSNLTLTNDNQAFRCIISESGCIDTSDIATLSITDDASISSQNEIRIVLCPNPVNNSFSVSGIEQIVSLTLKDLNGKSIKAFDVQDKNYSMSNVTSGVYFLEVRDEKRSYIVKVIKE
jgi:hypothetical protein